MGACVSSPQDKERERSARIDRSIEEDAKRFKKECKILLLGSFTNLTADPRLTRAPYAPSSGSGESGKSTIVKQMKIIHQNGYSHAELLMFRPTIYRNLLESAEAIVQAMRKLDIQPGLENNRNSDVLTRIEGWCSRMKAEGWWGGERGARGALMWQEGELESEAARAAHPGGVTLGNFFQAGVSNNGDIDGPLHLAPASKRKQATGDEGTEKVLTAASMQDPEAGLPPEIAQAIYDLFCDPMFKYLVEERSGDFYMMDSGV